MKNLLKIFLVILCTVTLFGCGSNKPESKNDVNNKTETEESNTKENDEPIYFSKMDDFTKEDINNLLIESINMTTHNTYNKSFDGKDTIKKDGLIVKPRIVGLYLANSFDTIPWRDGKTKTSQINMVLIDVEYDCEIQKDSIYYNKLENNKFKYNEYYSALNVYKENKKVNFERFTTTSSNYSVAEPIIILESILENDFNGINGSLKFDKINSETILYELMINNTVHLKATIAQFLSSFNLKLFEPETFEMIKIDLSKLK